MKLKYSASGPSANDGKKLNAPTSNTINISKNTNMAFVVESVPAVTAIFFFFAILPAIANAPTIGTKRTNNIIKTRSIITVVALMAQGITDSSLKFHLQNAKDHGVTQKEIAAIITHVAFYAGWPKGWAVFNLAKEVWNEDEAEK